MTTTILRHQAIRCLCQLLSECLEKLGQLFLEQPLNYCAIGIYLTPFLVVLLITVYFTLSYEAIGEPALDKPDRGPADHQD